MNLSRMTTLEATTLKDALNLTEDEELIYAMLCKGKSRIQIADRLNISLRTTDRRINDIKLKMNKVGKIEART